MSSELKQIIYLDGSGFEPLTLKSAAPRQLVRPGQQWVNARPHCYKCHHFVSNMSMTGRCKLHVKRGLIGSHDMMPGDGCRSGYSPKWTPEDGLIPDPAGAQ